MKTAAQELEIEFMASRAFYSAQQVMRYRAWAADKSHSYKSRLAYDRWAAESEHRIILCARRIEALLTIANA
jgi:hypothetical protein